MISNEERELFQVLCAPFEAEEVKIRSQSGRNLHYVTARTVMNRLDDVLGPNGWWDDYASFRDGAKCSLTIRMPDGEPVTKHGIGGVTAMNDPSDSDKTGESDALKRAAVKFGIGRYLYRDGVPGYLGSQPPPPEPARPQPRAPQRQQAAARPQPPQGNARPGPGHQARGFDEWAPPKTCKGVYPWLKRVDQTFGGALSTSNEIAKAEGFPWKSAEWDDAEVEVVCWGVIDAIKTWESYGGEFDHLEDPRMGE